MPFDAAEVARQIEHSRSSVHFEARAREKFGGQNSADGPKRWSEIWSAGHSVSGVRSITGAADLINEIAEQYDAAFGRCSP